MAESVRQRPDAGRRLPPEKVPRSSPWALLGLIMGLFLGVCLLLLALDFLLLRGEVILSERGVRFELLEDTPTRQGSDSPELDVYIERRGERHTLVISTYPQELALRWTLISPEGWEVLQGRDFVRNKNSRVIEFSPQTTGPHLLRIDRLAGQTTFAQVGLASPSGVDRVNVSIRVRDRSIVQRLLHRRGPYEWIIQSL